MVVGAVVCGWTWSEWSKMLFVCCWRVNDYCCLYAHRMYLQRDVWKSFEWLEWLLYVVWMTTTLLFDHHTLFKSIRHDPLRIRMVYNSLCVLYLRNKFIQSLKINQPWIHHENQLDSIELPICSTTSILYKTCIVPIRHEWEYWCIFLKIPL